MSNYNANQTTQYIALVKHMSASNLMQAFSELDQMANSLTEAEQLEIVSAAMLTE
jgi:hypothetical protein